MGGGLSNVNEESLCPQCFDLPAKSTPPDGTSTIEREFVVHYRPSSLGAWLEVRLYCGPVTVRLSVHHRVVSVVCVSLSQHWKIGHVQEILDSEAAQVKDLKDVAALTDEDLRLEESTCSALAVHK